MHGDLDDLCCTGCNHRIDNALNITGYDKSWAEMIVYEDVQHGFDGVIKF